MGKRIDGVDLSHFQKDIRIDWPRAKQAGVQFISHKATEGTSVVDESYGTRRAEAKTNGVVFGAYHFARPAVGNAEAEAKHFLATAQPKPGDLAPMLDLEVNDNHMSEDQLTVWVNTWFNTVFKALGVRRGLLYTHFNLSAKPKGVRLWVARYNNDNRAPVIPKPWFTWSIWQFSDGRFGTPNNVPGIGHVDIDTLHLRYPWVRLSRFILPKPKNAPAPAPTSPKVSWYRRRALRRFLAQGKGPVGYCLMRVHEAYGIGAKYPDAISAWNGAKHKHPETDLSKIPTGYPVFWRGGSSGHGHVAIKAYNGYRIETTDLIRAGYVDAADGRLVHERWGLTLLGWTEDLNGVEIK